MRDVWPHQWHLGLVSSIVIAVLLQLLLLRTLADGWNLLRKHLSFGVLCGVLNLLSRVLPAIGLASVADVLAELSLLGWGILLIQLSNLVLFRVLLPALRTTAPRIMQDIFFALACIAWGFMRLRVAGLDISGLVTTSAVITGIVAFSMQETLGNILGGLALQLDNSVRIGDWIKLDEVRGKVIEVHWRYTAVQTNNGEIVVIPNSALMKSKVDVFSSVDRPLSRRWVRFSTSYTVPPAQVIAAVEKALRGAQIEHVAATPLPQCIVTDYRDGMTHFAARYWLSDPQFDDGTDSTVRLHLYSCLQRQEFSLARPCLDVSLTSESDERNASQRNAAIASRLQTLSTVKLFSSLTGEELQQIASTLRDVIFTRNDVMTRQGAVAHWLYVLVSGEADVWYESDTHGRSHLATLTAGDVFGEMGMMTGAPRRATVTARTDAECYRIDKRSFETILLARPELAHEFARLLDERHVGLDAARHEEVVPSQVRQANILGSIRRFFHLPG